MSYLEDSIDWQVVRDVDAWLDAKVSPEYKSQPLAQDWARITKIAEELGEATDKFIAVTGQNPRKGKSGSIDDVLDELADVAMTAILAMHHFTKNDSVLREIFRRKQSFLYQRMIKEQNAPKSAQEQEQHFNLG